MRLRRWRMRTGEGLELQVTSSILRYIILD